MLRGARQRWHVFAGRKETTNAQDNKLLVEVAREMAADIGYAADGLAEIESDRATRVMSREVEETSDVIDQVEAWIGRAGIPWHRELASLFDAETKLRIQGHKSGGGEHAGVRRRVYGGQMAPSDALTIITDVAKDGSGSTGLGCARPFEDPQSALQGISASLDGVYEAQRDAIANVKDAMNEKQPEADPSLFETLLQIAVNVAISAAAGAIGAVAADRARKALEGTRAERLAGSNEYMSELLKGSDRARIIESVGNVPASLKEAVVIDVVKDGSKELFKSAAKAALDRAKSTDVGRDPKTHYFKLQLEAIQASRACRLYLTSAGPLRVRMPSMKGRHIECCCLRYMSLCRLKNPFMMPERRLAAVGRHRTPTGPRFRKKAHPAVFFHGLDRAARDW